MSRALQRFHVAATGFICILFAGFGFLNLRLLLQTDPSEGIARAAFSAGCLIFVTWAIALQIRFQRRIVSEFNYDGSLFHFRTLGIRQTQTRSISQIATVRDWRGRGGPLGYRIVFRDRAKVYLGYSVANAARVGERLRSDIS